LGRQQSTVYYNDIQYLKPYKDTPTKTHGKKHYREKALVTTFVSQKEDVFLIFFDDTLMKMKTLNMEALHKREKRRTVGYPPRHSLNSLVLPHPNQRRNSHVHAMHLLFGRSYRAMRSPAGTRHQIHT